jgi:hypothetical protein
MQNVNCSHLALSIYLMEKKKTTLRRMKESDDGNNGNHSIPILFKDSQPDFHYDFFPTFRIRWL